MNDALKWFIGGAIAFVGLALCLADDTTERKESELDAFATMVPSPGGGQDGVRSYLAAVTRESRITFIRGMEFRQTSFLMYLRGGKVVTVTAVNLHHNEYALCRLKTANDTIIAEYIAYADIDKVSLILEEPDYENLDTSWA